jgi:AraC-like DNA-binding protein
MQYLERPPSPHLAQYVKCYWTLEEDTAAQGAEAEPVVPDGCIEIVFNLADRFERLHGQNSIETQPATIVAGQMSKSVMIRPTGQIALFGVRFRQTGAFPFFRFALSELTDRIDGLDLIWGAEGSLFEEQISEAPGFAARVGLVEARLTKSLLNGPDPDHSLIKATHTIVRNRGQEAIHRVARRVGMSERQLERAFRQKIGVSPKLFSRIVRFQNVLTLLEKNGGTDLLDTALAAGYYDQAHLIKDFGQFAGKSPGSFLADSHRMSEAFVVGE